MPQSRRCKNTDRPAGGAVGRGGWGWKEKCTRGERGKNGGGRVKKQVKGTRESRSEGVASKNTQSVCWRGWGLEGIVGSRPMARPRPAWHLTQWGDAQVKKAPP